MAGKVPNPKIAMNNAPSKSPPYTKEPSNAKYTAPQGSKPLIIPQHKERQGAFALDEFAKCAVYKPVQLHVDAVEKMESGKNSWENYPCNDERSKHNGNGLQKPHKLKGLAHHAEESSEQSVNQNSPQVIHHGFEQLFSGWCLLDRQNHGNWSTHAHAMQTR